MSAPRDLNALLGSRICHDLISPLGAIGNGVELLTMSGAAAAPEIALIAESVDSANARIRFFRVAFGHASPGQGLGASEIRAILKDLYQGSRISVVWQAEGDSLRREVKLVFLLLLCLETAMPWGGRILVQREGGTWTIAGTAERMSVNPEMWRLLSEPEADADLTSANVHFALAPEAAGQLQRQIDARLEDRLITLTI